MTADMHGYLPQEAILRCKNCGHDVFVSYPQSVDTKAPTWTYVFRCRRCRAMVGITASRSEEGKE